MTNSGNPTCSYRQQRRRFRWLADARTCVAARVPRSLKEGSQKPVRPMEFLAGSSQNSRGLSQYIWRLPDGQGRPLNRYAKDAMNSDPSEPVNPTDQDGILRLRARFRPHEHVRARQIFQQVFAQRRAVSDSTLVVHALSNGLSCARLGISVPRRGTRHAVVRNRLKRLVREAFRIHKGEIPIGFDLIVVPRRSDLSAVAVVSSLRSLAPDAVRRASKETLRTPPAAKDPTP